MDGANPYQTPKAELSSPTLAALSGSSDLSGAVQAFSETKVWLRLISISGFLILGIAALGVSISIAFDGMPFIAGLGSLFGFFLVAVPVVQVHLYANSIDALVKHADATNLERAVRSQKAFWTTFGVVILLSVLLFAALSLLAVF
ncbi:MAG: hypothetical protein AAF654_14200 [Myxococcota bacterium]